MPGPRPPARRVTTTGLSSLRTVGLAVAGEDGADSRRGGTVLVRPGRRRALPRRLRRRARDWERVRGPSGPTAAGLLASAALAAGYGGDRAHAVALLAEAREHEATSPNGSNHAFITYVEGELLAVDDPAAADPPRTSPPSRRRAASAPTSWPAWPRWRWPRPARGPVTWRPPRRRTDDLLDYWRTTGHGPQLWTTARNAATLLLAEGHPREARLAAPAAPTPPRRRRPSTPTSPGTAAAASCRSPRVVGGDELESLRAEVGGPEHRRGRRRGQGRSRGDREPR